MKHFKRGISPKKSLSIGTKEYYTENHDALFEAFEKLGIGKVNNIDGNCIVMDLYEHKSAEREQVVSWFRKNTHYYITTPGFLQARTHSKNFTLMNEEYRRWNFYWVSKSE